MSVQRSSFVLVPALRLQFLARELVDLKMKALRSVLFCVYVGRQFHVAFGILHRLRSSERVSPQSAEHSAALLAVEPADGTGVDPTDGTEYAELKQQQAELASELKLRQAAFQAEWDAFQRDQKEQHERERQQLEIEAQKQRVKCAAAESLAEAKCKQVKSAEEQCVELSAMLDLARSSSEEESLLSAALSERAGEAEAASESWRQEAIAEAKTMQMQRFELACAQNKERDLRSQLETAQSLVPEQQSMAGQGAQRPFYSMTILLFQPD